MTDQTVKEILLSLKEDYQKSSKTSKTITLNHLTSITKRDRKHLIKALSRLPKNLKEVKRSGRPGIYSKKDLLPHVSFLWIQMERASAKRMKEGLKDWLPFYKECPAHLRLQLLKMSSSTLARYISEIRESLETRRGISTTAPARYMKNKVPINTLDSTVNRPGYTQTDTVAHCGNSALGPFISSLTVTDLNSTWTENRSLFTKRGRKVRDCFAEIERSLPFKLLAINADSGSEFINKAMLEFTHFGTRVQYTRSRPYKKNDNCYVEQKNFTHVRELFGYERFDEEILVALMNEIYTEYWNPLQNFFLPSMKLKEKVRIGGVIHKKYDTPQTAYTRLITSPHLTVIEKQDLIDRKAKLNPFELKKGLEKKLEEFFELQRQLTIRKAS